MFIVPLSGLTPVGAAETGAARGGAPQEGARLPFADTLKGAIEDLKESQAASAQDSYDLAMGNVTDLHTLMIRSAKEATAVETVVQLTSRAVSAYKEIMQMQV